MCDQHAECLGGDDYRAVDGAINAIGTISGQTAGNLGGLQTGREKEEAQGEAARRMGERE